MRLGVVMGADDEFVVETWRAQDPSAVVAVLRKQLVAAAAVWPSLNGVRLIDDADKPKQ